MKKYHIALIVAATAVSVVFAQDAMEPLTFTLPKLKLDGTPVPVNVPNLEPSTKREPLMVPAGVTNLAAGRPVTSSISVPIIGELELITDGDKSSEEGSFVELDENTQWVQVDLENEAALYAVLFWHFHSQLRAYSDVVVQVSNDPDFKTGVTTVFNNDIDNSSGLGVGKDKAFISNHEGKLILLNGVKARYVRLYSNGNSANPYNHYIEIEVFGKPSA